MADEVKKGILAAYRNVLRPLVRILLRHGVSFSELSDVVKSVYVEVALKDFKVPGKRGTRSRLAVVTGLTRKEVKRVIDEEVDSTFVVSSNRNRIARVLVGWFTDPNFVGPYGVPLELKYEGDEGDLSTFVELVRRHSGDMSPRSMLDELTRIGAVIETEKGWFKVLRRDYMPEVLAPDSLERLGVVIRNFIDTLDYNLQQSKTSEKRFERQVYADHGIRPEDLPVFKEYVRVRCQHLLEEIDNWLSALEAPKDGQKSVAVQTGVGIYHYIQDQNQDITFKQLLEEEGLLRIPK